MLPSPPPADEPPPAAAPPPEPLVHMQVPNVPFDWHV
jgi:hypothetical protein